MANDSGLRKRSATQTVYIQVTAVNDEPPVITVNRVLRVSLPGSIFTLFFFISSSGNTAHLSDGFHVGSVVAMAERAADGKYDCYVEEGRQHRP